MDNISSNKTCLITEKLDLSLGKEWALLELITMGLYSDDEQAIFTDLIKAQDLNWSTLIQQAERHKILTLLAFYLLSEKYLTKISPSFGYKSRLSKILFLNKHKLNIYRQETAKIITAFKDHKINFVGTKGISIESTIYPGYGSRTMGDIDFMILPQERNIVSEILSNLGYTMGEYDHQTKQIKPHSRKVMIQYKLSPDHLPSHVLLSNSIIVPCIEVDIANSLTWTSCPFQIPVEVALEKINYQSIPGIENTQLPVFTPQFQFLFTILHLFKEAWIEITLDMNGKDVNLSKFSDVIRIWRCYQKELSSLEFVAMLEKFSLTQAVLWVLEHLDRTFQMNIVKTLGLENQVTEEWLHSAGNSSNGKIRYWKGTMKNRLYTINRKDIFN